MAWSVAPVVEDLAEVCAIYFAIEVDIGAIGQALGGGTHHVPRTRAEAARGAGASARLHRLDLSITPCPEEHGILGRQVLVARRGALAGTEGEFIVLDDAVPDDGRHSLRRGGGADGGDGGDRAGVGVGREAADEGVREGGSSNNGESGSSRDVLDGVAAVGVRELVRAGAPSPK